MIFSGSGVESLTGETETGCYIDPVRPFVKKFFCLSLLVSTFHPLGVPGAGKLTGARRGGWLRWRRSLGGAEEGIHGEGPGMLGAQYDELSGFGAAPGGLRSYIELEERR